MKKLEQIQFKDCSLSLSSHLLSKIIKIHHIELLFCILFDMGVELGLLRWKKKGV